MCQEHSSNIGKYFSERLSGDGHAAGERLRSRRKVLEIVIPNLFLNSVSMLCKVPKIDLEEAQCTANYRSPNYANGRE